VGFELDQLCQLSLLMQVEAQQYSGDYLNKHRTEVIVLLVNLQRLHRCQGK